MIGKETEYGTIVTFKFINNLRRRVGELEEQEQNE
tara:strand:- start:1196 stop:1300 length:105 start_codon:yes stop_codon:yes gene_type:complete